MTATDPLTSRVFLARHAQTALNAEGRLRGLADPELDPTGIAEAERLAHALIGNGFSLVLSSPLRRANHTAALVAEASGVPHRADARFNDRDYGQWTGQLTTDVLARWGSIDNAPGVESVQHVLERALPALNAIADDARSVVVVTHDAIIRPIITAIDPARPRAAVPSASWSELTRTDDHWRVVNTDRT